MMFHQKSSKYPVLLAPVQTNELVLGPPKKTEWLLPKSNYDSAEKRETVQENPRKTPGSTLKSLPVFSTVPPSKTSIPGQETQFLEPRNIFP